MTKTKKVTKRRKGQSASKAMLGQKRDELDNLYDAAIAFIEARGGKVVVIGGVSVIELPGDKKFNYVLGVRVTGVRPIKQDAAQQVIS